MGGTENGAGQGNEDAGAAAAQAAKDGGMPAWVAILMVWEASLLRKVWIAIKRAFGRDGT